METRTNEAETQVSKLDELMAACEDVDTSDPREWLKLAPLAFAAYAEARAKLEPIKQQVGTVAAMVGADLSVVVTAVASTLVGAVDDPTCRAALKKLDTMKAERTREQYLAYIAAGFTSAQAMALVLADKQRQTASGMLKAAGDGARQVASSKPNSPENDR